MSNNLKPDNEINYTCSNHYLNYTIDLIICKLAIFLFSIVFLLDNNIYIIIFSFSLRKRAREKDFSFSLLFVRTTRVHKKKIDNLFLFMLK